jgi:hypothetical protein
MVDGGWWMRAGSPGCSEFSINYKLLCKTSLARVCSFCKLPIFCKCNEPNTVCTVHHDVLLLTGDEDSRGPISDQSASLPSLFSFNFCRLLNYSLIMADEPLPTEADSLLNNKRKTGGTDTKVNNWHLREAFWLTLLLAAVAGTTWLIKRRRQYIKYYETFHDTFVDDALCFDTDFDTTYSATQFISFSVNTEGGSAEHGECKGRTVDEFKKCYLGNFNIIEDAYHRLDIVKSVLKRLEDDEYQEFPRINHDPNVLKIFMLPEFFLRGPYGAYSAAQLLDSEDDDKAGLLIQIATEIREVIAKDAFKDYLFVFGTTVVAQVVGDDPSQFWWEHNDLNATEVLYYNFAPIMKGGLGHHHYYIITKKYLSVGDFLHRSQLPIQRTCGFRVMPPLMSPMYSRKL